MIAVGYLFASTLFAVMLYRSKTPTVGTLHTVAALFVSVVWGAWYVTLAVFDPPLHPWGALNRALHFFTIGLFLLIAWSRLHYMKEPNV